MLKIVAVHLKTLGLKYGIIDGTVNPKHRMDLVEDFNTNPKGPQVTCNYSTELQQTEPLFTNPAMNFICHLCVCVQGDAGVSMCWGRRSQSDWRKPPLPH